LYAKATAIAREEILAAQRIPPVVVPIPEEKHATPAPGQEAETERIDILASLLNPALVSVARNYSDAAIRIALIPPSSAPLESAFSVLNWLVPARRSRLTARHIGMIASLACNIEIVDSLIDQIAADFFDDASDLRLQLQPKSADDEEEWMEKYASDEDA
jgi:hypothetical protein